MSQLPYCSRATFQFLEQEAKNLETPTRPHPLVTASLPPLISAAALINYAFLVVMSKYLTETTEGREGLFWLLVSERF